jgi:hypothetical protein
MGDAVGGGFDLPEAVGGVFDDQLHEDFPFKLPVKSAAVERAALAQALQGASTTEQAKAQAAGQRTDDGSRFGEQDGGAQQQLGALTGGQAASHEKASPINFLNVVPERERPQTSLWRRRAGPFPRSRAEKAPNSQGCEYLMKVQLERVWRECGMIFACERLIARWLPP